MLPSRAFALIAISGSGTWGAFEGSLDYSIVDDTAAILTIQLTNTSDLSNGGYLTAFALNNVGQAFTGITLDTAPTTFTILGAPTFNNSVSAGPNGHFDFGAGLGGAYEGGGSPTNGLAVNSSGTFIFHLSGSGLSLLNDLSFFSELSVPPSDGEGTLAFVVRFRGFDNDESDKVPGNVVPEPASMLLIGSGLIGSALVKRRKV